MAEEDCGESFPGLCFGQKRRQGGLFLPGTLFQVDDPALYLYRREVPVKKGLCKVKGLGSVVGKGHGDCTGKLASGTRGRFVLLPLQEEVAECGGSWSGAGTDIKDGKLPAYRAR